MSEQQLSLSPVEPVLEVELVDGTIADELDDVAVVAAPSPTGVRAAEPFLREAEPIAGRAASASTRRQYSSIFRAFGDWLAEQLARPLVGEL